MLTLKGGPLGEHLSLTSGLDCTQGAPPGNLQHSSPLLSCPGPLVASAVLRVPGTSERSEAEAEAPICLPALCAQTPVPLASSLAVWEPLRPLLDLDQEQVPANL